MKNLLILGLFGMLLAQLATPVMAADDELFLTFKGADGPGKGKKIVLVAGDEEYRSEETMPMLAKILSMKHGFDCTVVFSIDPKTGMIDPKYQKNTPGLEALDNADLMIILTRFRNLPDAQMKHVDEYLMKGKPVIGMRTATHAFDGLKGAYEKYNWGYKGPVTEMSQGFGRAVLGETWINHHGGHKTEATKGIFAPGAEADPILTGIKGGEIWGPSDVYGVRLPLPGDSKPLVLGQVTKRNGPKKNDAEDVFYGLSPNDQPVAGDKRNSPMMPVAWTKSYQIPEGKAGKAFATTMGSSTDMTNAPLRRMIVNAVYVLTDLKVPAEANVDYVGEFKPSAYGFDGHKKGVHPAELK